MTLNGVITVTLHYFTEFGKPVFQPRRSVHGRIYALVYCIFSACTISSYRKFTFAISSPDEFLVLVLLLLLPSLLGNVAYVKKQLPSIFAQLAPKNVIWNASCVERVLPFTTLH